MARAICAVISITAERKAGVWQTGLIICIVILKQHEIKAFPQIVPVIFAPIVASDQTESRFPAPSAAGIGRRQRPFYRRMPAAPATAD
jgi:hypothetical protein